jgi:two-component sensor histidine kinase
MPSEPLVASTMPEVALAPFAFRRSFSVRASALVALLGVILIVPGIVFLAFLARNIEADRHNMATTMGVEVAGRVVSAIEMEIGTSKTLLQVYARSGWLEEDALARLHQRARSVLSSQGLYLIVLDESGQQLLNTRVAYGAPLGPSSDAGALAAAAGRRFGAVSDFFYGGVAQAWVFNVIRVVEFVDGRRRVLILTQDMRRLMETMRASLGAGWTFDLRDGQGNAFSADMAEGSISDDGPSPCDLDASARPRNLVAISTDVAVAPWSVCVWREHYFEASPLANQAMVLAACAVWMVAAIGGALVLGRRLSREIEETAALASAIAHNRCGQPAPAIVREVKAIRVSLREAAVLIGDRERERRLILNETAHRAKNQMAIALSLVNLSAREAGTVEEMKAGLWRRLSSLARAIDVTQSTAAGEASLEAIIESQLSAFTQRDGDKLAWNGPTLTVDAAAAQSLSLVFYELATNAHKHGAWSVENGSVSITWRREGEMLAIVWEEDGKRSEVSTRVGFGSKLMCAIVETGFGGSLTSGPGPRGMIIRLDIPVSALRIA